MPRLTITSCLLFTNFPNCRRIKIVLLLANCSYGFCSVWNSGTCLCTPCEGGWGSRTEHAHAGEELTRFPPPMQQIPQTEPAHRKQRVSKQFRGNLTPSQTDSQYEGTHSPNVCTGPLVSKRTRRAVVNARWLTQIFAFANVAILRDISTLPSNR